MTTRNRSRCWFFTFNNYEEKDINCLIKFFDMSQYKYLFQEEIGENKTQHLQGIIVSQIQISFSTLKNFSDKIHWEKTRNKKAAFEYCSKLDSRIGKIYNNTEYRPLDNPMEGLTFKDWQNEILEMIKIKPKQNDRTINWYYDTIGACGKTTFAKYLCMKYRNKILYLSGKCNDIKYGVYNFLQKHELTCVIFSFVRTNEQYISYEAIESIKDGIFYNTKYESNMIIYNIPHVLVFANFKPESYKLSLDRWQIKEIS